MLDTVSQMRLSSAMLTVAITSLPRAMTLLHRPHKIVLAFFFRVHTSHCKLMSNILLGNSIKNLYVTVSQVSLFKLDYTCLFSLNIWANGLTDTHTVPSPLPNTRRTELNFLPSPSHLLTGTDLSSGAIRKILMLLLSRMSCLFSEYTNMWAKLQLSL